MMWGLPELTVPLSSLENRASLAMPMPGASHDGSCGEGTWNLPEAVIRTVPSSLFNSLLFFPPFTVHLPWLSRNYEPSVRTGTRYRKLQKSTCTSNVRDHSDLPILIIIIIRTCLFWNFRLLNFFRCVRLLNDWRACVEVCTAIWRMISVDRNDYRHLKPRLWTHTDGVTVISRARSSSADCDCVSRTLGSYQGYTGSNPSDACLILDWRYRSGTLLFSHGNRRT